MLIGPVIMTEKLLKAMQQYNAQVFPFSQGSLTLKIINVIYLKQLAE